MTFTAFLILLAVIAMWIGAFAKTSAIAPWVNWMVLSFALLLTAHFFGLSWPWVK